MAFVFNSRRSTVIANRGMVATSNPLAAQAGLNILRQGGNAADAAIATAAVLNVTEPGSTGVGGDCFALYYDSKTKQVTALNGSGRTPAALNTDYLRTQGITNELPARSVHAITVPGAAMGWYDLLKHHGRMTLKDVLQDAIQYARNGFPVAEIFGNFWNDKNIDAFLKNSPNTEDYHLDGSISKIGQIVRFPGLANTFEQIAEGGPQAFYKGKIADAIVRTIQSLGGLMTHDDLKKHHSTWDVPICTNYRGTTVYECPPNGQGLAALLALNLAEGYELSTLPWDSAERLHLMIESMRLAFADARRYIADPSKVDVPTYELLDPHYAAKRRKLISEQYAMQPPSFGLPFPSSDTVYLCTTDSEGNACSFINSLYMAFGTGIVAQGTGVFLQNRGMNFVLDLEHHPNVLEGNKRPYHTIMPCMALRDGMLYATYGIVGGFMQPQGHFQLTSALVDDGKTPQEALNRPRWCLEAGTSSMLAVEEGYPASTLTRLKEFGHGIRLVSGYERALFGSGQIIQRDPRTGVLYGGCDPRADSIVAAY